MLIKKFTDIKNPEIWDLSENEDIIITKENTDKKRVLVNYDIYKTLKDALNQYRQHQLAVKDADEFDLNPHLKDLNAIVKNGNFKDITDQPYYFENMADKKTQREHNQNFRKWLKSYINYETTFNFEDLIKKLSYANAGRKFTRDELNER